jgi:predicted nucleic acid-binding protein
MHFLAVDMTDIARAYEIMTIYADTPIGFVDASIVALAERYKIRQVLTLDRRHFAMFRPRGLGYLELLPTL